jgi:hypothetical protein
MTRIRITAPGFAAGRLGSARPTEWTPGRYHVTLDDETEWAPMDLRLKDGGVLTVQHRRELAFDASEFEVLQ